MWYRRWGKRATDLLLGASLLLLLLPVLFLVAAVVRFGLGHPVLFRQARPGLGGQLFVLNKFRTMVDRRDAEGRVLPDADRLTTLGRFLRSTSLDELPALVNVVSGDMSLVGPRPLLVQYLDRYTPEQHRRHNVRPGVTGWAQIKGRNALEWDRRLALDVWYVDNVSLKLDVVILVRTVWKVLVRDGIAFPGQVTMPEFQGTKSSPKRPPAGEA
jgi:lipopolysaccharide/colanic/teichoic acid biosynthesis glycosyltransferase